MFISSGNLVHAVKLGPCKMLSSMQMTFMYNMVDASRSEKKPSENRSRWVCPPRPQQWLWGHLSQR